jgi:two-component system CAI-1 autoinducer sensor kinase/phosphatase CqsS
VGFIGFPLYYVIWEYLFPQPYENLLLRLIGCALFLPFVLIKYWPAGIKPLLPFYWLIACTYALPFFFTFMTLMNDASPVWGMSTMAAILLLFFMIYDWRLINLIFFIGAAFACLGYKMTTDAVALPYDYLEQVPIYLFTIVAGSICSYELELSRQERLRMIQSIGSGIAHELRTPLLGIKGGVAGLRNYLPKLIAAYKIAAEHELEIPKIRKSHFNALASLIDRIDAETVFSNSIIDILLMNSGNVNIDRSKFSECSINMCISTALDRYPFQSPIEREKIHFIQGEDFSFFGSDILFVHVIFNLIKNALAAIHDAGKGEITIRTCKNGNTNEAIFTDTGKGIEAAVSPYIFNQFYTTSPHGKGAGIGLSFCRYAIESFGGKISVKSDPGKFTEFTIAFTES